MHVVLDVTRHIVVNNNLHAFDVKTPCSHVGGNEDLDVSAAETLQRTITVGLRSIPVDGRRPNPIHVKKAINLVRSALHLYKYQNLSTKLLQQL